MDGTVLKYIFNRYILVSLTFRDLTIQPGAFINAEQFNLINSPAWIFALKLGFYTKLRAFPLFYQIPQSKSVNGLMSLIVHTNYTNKQGLLLYINIIINKLGFQGASLPSSFSTFNYGFICEHLLFVKYKKRFLRIS